MAKSEPNVTRSEIDSLVKYTTVQRWLKKKRPESIYNYSRYMILFTRATGKTPDEFLSWAKTHESVEVQDLIDQTAETIAFESSRFNFKVEMRSFLRTNGFNNLPKSALTYTLKEWHRGYRKEEIRELDKYLDDKLQKVYLLLLVETGLRANTVLSIRYKHLSEDLEAGTVPVAVRLGPEFYNRKKSAGFTFLGKRSVTLIKELIKEGRIKPEPEALLINRIYPVMFKILATAKRKANLDRKIQVHHGLRKYFENNLIGVDPDDRRLLEGHFTNTRDKHYTDREWDRLRPIYEKVYPHIDIFAGDPELEEKIKSWQDEKRQLLERFEAERSEWRRELNDLRDLVKKEISDRKKE